MEQEHSFLVDRLRGEFLKATGPVPRELHHYTNAKGMLGIIEAGELWASNALFLNDAEELEIGLAIYKGIIAGSRTTEGANHSARVKELFDCSELHAEMLRQSAVFVTCFSAAENQLSQWRGYGGNTVGYSITFNTDGIKEMQQAGFSLLRVLYEREEQAKLVLETVAGFAAYIDSLPAEGWEHEKPRLDWFFINWLHFLLIGMKRDAFREEKEWRLASRDWDVEEPTYSFRTSLSGMVVPYRILKRPNDNRLPITRILVGPTNHPELAVRSVKQLLRKHGYVSVEVEFCDIPLREL